ncbi:hypothetical protein BpHYR1_000194 [Brachionus plicatilis]|uniref:Uncharacterized protein n=1 Tax=Brachionus plicatilis TaxID=10195 RepID=A0A3M7P5G9_BRAPC|nr:hypothetical protein BpHYR1_000194 [Brachionus plicatilis]
MLSRFRYNLNDLSHVKILARSTINKKSLIKKPFVWHLSRIINDTKIYLLYFIYKNEKILMSLYATGYKITVCPETDN